MEKVILGLLLLATVKLCQGYQAAESVYEEKIQPTIEEIKQSGN